ncbi:MAG: hypothetical protein V7K77_32425 [Nostoc sp.]
MTFLRLYRHGNGSSSWGATAVFSQGETPRAMGSPQVEQVAWETLLV